MAKYDGLIIPRSYNDYVNKSDPIGVSQALQLTGVMDNAPTAQSTKPAKSGGIFAANAVIMANNKTLSGVAISTGSVVRVLFTAALTGSDATTGLTLTYNGNTYAVKAGKDGALVALTAHLIEESYVYLQAYTTLELAFDGSQFVVMGNPVVISNANFSIMADGTIAYHEGRIGIRRLQSTTYTNDTNGRFLTIKTSNTNIPYYQRFLYFVSNSSGSLAYVLIGESDDGYEVQFKNLNGNLLESASYIDVDGYVGIKIKVASGWSTLNEVEAITGTLLSISQPSLT